jgi:hypothetical protein
MFAMKGKQKKTRADIFESICHMTEKNSLTFFDQLATEILFEIFDYLSCNDILYSFFYFNQRLNSIILKNQRYLNQFETPRTNFSFWERILPIIKSEIKYLTITTTDFRISLDLFSNLQSLIISLPLPVYYDEFISILENEQFKKLTIFKIRNDEFLYRNTPYQQISISQKVFYHQNSLQIFESFLQLHVSPFNNQINNMNHLQSLSIKLSIINEIFILLEYTPNLKYLNLFLSSLYLNNKLGLTKIQLKNFSCTLKNHPIDEKNFPVLTNFIRQFSSSLICLSLNLNYIQSKDYQFDGYTLEKQLLNSMIQLKSFHLYVKFDEEPIDIEHLLSTFENRFWIDHHWSIGMHKNYLYTLPFHFDKLEDFIDFDHIKSKMLDSPATWSHVTSIDLSKSTDFNSNLIKQLKFKMPNLTSIIFNSEPTNEYEINSTLDSITTVHYQGEYLQNIKEWFIHIFPNTKHFVFSYQPSRFVLSTNRIGFLQKLDVYYRRERIKKDYNHLLNIQSIQIKLILKDLDVLYKHVLRLIRELLQIFPNLQSFIFQFYSIDYSSFHVPYTDLNELIQLLNLDKISKKYQIKHIQNYFQFIKKSQ